MADPIPTADQCTTMAEVRAAIDEVDQRIVTLLAERMRYIEAAARIKQDRDAVRDEARKAEVIDHAAAVAAGSGVSSRPCEEDLRSARRGLDRLRARSVRCALTPSGSFQRAEHAAQRPHFLRVPAGLGEERAERAPDDGHAIGRVIIADRDKHGIDLVDQAVQFILRGGRFEIGRGGLGKALALRPFIGEQDHRLGEIEAAEFGIDRHGDDRARDGNIVGLEARALGAEEDRGSPRSAWIARAASSRR
jgi:isochorismate pyruvate lyase